MSQSQQLSVPTPAPNREEPADVGAVLDALDDADCRQILEATSDDSLTASELADTCDLPLSTTYRKVDRLTDASLLRETIRIHRSGKHVNQYERNVEDVVITVEDGGQLGLSVTHCDRGGDRGIPAGFYQD